MRRETDRQVASALRKTPLDVAADRIAYAAHTAGPTVSKNKKVERETVEWGRKPGSVPGVVAFAGWRPFI